MAAAHYLIDASLCLGILAGRSPAAAERLAGCEIGQVVTSSVVCAEVMAGAARRGAAEPALALFAQIPVLPFDEAAAGAYARLPFGRGGYDRLVAAQALSLGLTVVTGNLAGFADVPGLEIEIWAQA